MLGVEGILVCVNKMDGVEYAESVFREIVTEFERSIRTPHHASVAFLPVSALKGDNVTSISHNMPWYDGPTLMEYLESFPIGTNIRGGGGRFGVQWAIRPRGGHAHGYRGYAGRVLQGEFRTGDEIVVLPSEQRTRIRAIELYGAPLDVASTFRSVVMRFEDEIDIGRGDIVATVADRPTIGHRIEADICWMSERELTTRTRLLLQSLSFRTPCVVDAIPHKVDVVSGDHVDPNGRLALNDIGRIALHTASPVVHDPYIVNRQSGSFILIDERDNATVAAGLIR
jgi:sulfate adenylyltransferase subunit 1 (EFTu-like GTPase family)